MLKRTALTISVVVLLAASAFAQDGHITYKRHGNTKHLGRTVLFKTDGANIDTLTSVHAGTIAYDTTEAAIQVYTNGRFHPVANGVVRDTVVDVNSAQILALNTTPIDAVAAPGAGYAIDVLSAVVWMNYNTAAYATNTKLALQTSGATVNQYELTVLDASVDAYRSMEEVYTTSTTATQLLANTKLVITAPGGDPVTGDGTLKVYIRYQVIEL